MSSAGILALDAALDLAHARIAELETRERNYEMRLDLAYAALNTAEERLARYKAVLADWPALDPECEDAWHGVERVVDELGPVDGDVPMTADCICGACGWVDPESVGPDESAPAPDRMDPGGMDLDQVGYGGLDPGIRETVRTLREAGFDTTDSGDGESKQAAGFTDALATPHVFIRPREPGAWGLISEACMLRDYLRSMLMDLPKIGGAIEATYDPYDDDVGVVMLRGLSDYDWV